MTGKIPEQLIEEIRSQSDIVDVISDYMQLTKRGRNWFGLCPFHGEQTPSFSVSQDKQIFHCFGCGAGGNAITFIMDIEQIPFPDAVVKLSERVGVSINVDLTSNREQKTYSKKEEQMREAHEFAVDFYHHLLMNTEDGEVAYNYLLERGFTREMIEVQKIGWALPSWDAMSKLLARKGYNMSEIAESGLVIEKEGQDEYFDRFRGRIMFPIRDEYGKVIAFSGRVIEQNTDEAKYLNSPESPIFHKSEVLYNLDKARAAIRKNRHVIIMEGFGDVLAANRAGVMNVVGTMGTSLTQQHITKLKRLVTQVTICYDGDNAGFEAAKRAAVLLNDAKLHVEVAVLPDKLDPDDYIKRYGAESFNDKILGKPHAYIAFIMMHAKRGKNFQFENDTLQYMQEVLEQLVGKTSPIERDLYIRQLAAETNISQEAIYAQFRKLEADTIKQGKPDRYVPVETIATPVENRKLTATDRAERLLFSHMLHDLTVVDRFIAENNLAPFVHDEYNVLFIKLIGFYEEQRLANYQRFAEIVEESRLRSIIMEATAMDRDPDKMEVEIADCLKHLEKHRVQQQIECLLHEQGEAEKMHEYNRAIEILKEIVELKRKLSMV
jgi:DNA primase